METKYALITGAAGGLGKSLAIACAKRKYHLLLVDLPGTKIQSLADQIEFAYDIKAHTLPLDFCQTDAVDKLKEWIEGNSFNLSLLINNVGIGLNQSFESVVSMNNSTVQIIQITGCKTTTFERNQRPKFRW